MEKPLKDLSASTLRQLLIEEINVFIKSLDAGSSDELQQKKDRINEILDLLKEKENNETPLNWGKSSKNNAPIA